jgi:hypothetical protein
METSKEEEEEEEEELATKARNEECCATDLFEINFQIRIPNLLLTS